MFGRRSPSPVAEEEMPYTREVIEVKCLNRNVLAAKKQSMIEPVLPGSQVFSADTFATSECPDPENDTVILEEYTSEHHNKVGAGELIS